MNSCISSSISPILHANRRATGGRERGAGAGLWLAKQKLVCRAGAPLIASSLGLPYTLYCLFFPGLTTNFQPSAFVCRKMSTASALSEDSADNDIKTVNVRIKGKVQGVFYRNWTVDSAKQLGLKGWVRNRRDGSVEAVFSGSAAIVNTMIQKCYQGPEMAKVSSLDLSPWNGSLPEAFERKPTEW